MAEWWKGLDPSLGWIIGIALFLAVVLRDVLQKTLVDGGRKLVDALLRRISATPALRPLALRRYKRTLIGKYANVALRPNVEFTMEQMYVPLAVRRGNDDQPVDAIEALHEGRRTVILGPPGCGKSMLLRSIAFAWGSERSPLPPKVIPVLLELNRFNDSEGTLVEQLVAALERSGFKRAKAFVDRGIEGGTLLLLLDGFDEIHVSRRQFVARAINDLAEQHPDCRFVVTCRTPVYHEELAPSAGRVLHVLDLSDDRIAAFLEPWRKYMPEGKSPALLIDALRERPSILLLARNPLLLAIVAYLYLQPDFTLPASRAEFYDTAVDTLLRQWKEQRNVYRAPQKRRVLEHLALVNHISGGAEGEDRRTIDHDALVREVNGVLPAVNLSASDTFPLLDEVVDRSGLMAYIDGGARCQFVHLTLQEFLAASALLDRGDELTRRFAGDRDAWREVVKLWCGLARDATPVIEAVRSIEPETAFAALAEARHVDPLLARAIVAEDELRFAEGQWTDDAAQHAFAAVAATSKPAGVDAFEFLVHQARHAATDQVRRAAASALSLTDLPRAATVLAELYVETGQTGSLLVRMGDVAVRPIVEKVAPHRSEDAIRLLANIRSVSAMTVLINLSPTYAKAAIEIARLFDHPAARTAARRPGDFLRSTHLQALGGIRDLQWAWEPFNPDPDDDEALVALLLISLLVRQFREGKGPFLHLDPRLALAACMVIVHGDGGNLGEAALRILDDTPSPRHIAEERKLVEDYANRLRREAEEPPPIEEVIHKHREVYYQIEPGRPRREFVASTPSLEEALEIREKEMRRARDRCEVLEQYLRTGVYVSDREAEKSPVFETVATRVSEREAWRKRQPNAAFVRALASLPSTIRWSAQSLFRQTISVQTWRDAANPSSFRFDDSPHFRLILLTQFILSILALMALGRGPFGTVTYVVIAAVVVAVVMLIVAAYRNNRPFTTWVFVTLAPFFAVLFPLTLMTRRGPSARDWGAFFGALVFAPLTPGLLYFSHIELVWLLGERRAVVTEAIAACVLLLVVLLAVRSSRLAANPVRPLLSQLRRDGPPSYDAFAVAEQERRLQEQFASDPVLAAAFMAHGTIAPDETLTNA